jgi:glycosyltransferase involved in cell wall biosynthesis
MRDSDSRRARRCVFATGLAYVPTRSPQETVFTVQDIRNLARTGKILAHLWRYRSASAMTTRVESMNRPLMTALILRFLTLGACCFEDTNGTVVRVGAGKMAQLIAGFLRAFSAGLLSLRRVRQELGELAVFVKRRTRPLFSPGHRTVYLRTDAVTAPLAGGAVGHIAGVLNNLAQAVGDPVFITTGPVPAVAPQIETHVIHTPPEFLHFPEKAMLRFNQALKGPLREVLDGESLSMIYQRSSCHNYSGLALASKHGVPFVLEYNGPAVWVSRNWGTRLKHEAYAEEIETLNLQGADLIVVVSDALREGLLARGIEGDKILVNPNGVDPQVYSPQVDGSAVRRRCGLGDDTVVGFIGTFGPWHGAEVLAEAFGILLRTRPQLRSGTRLLMIGDGHKMTEVRDNLSRYDVTAECILTGMVPQAEGPSHLAACDVLVCPTVPNPDGSPFFGSPTKLFEYMAMGKGVVASQIGQIADVLEHERTAWLVPPRDADALAEGIAALIDEPDLRERLGRAARDEVVLKYTWKQHTQRIIDALQGRCGR